MAHPIEALVHSYIDAWNRHDVAELLACFTEDCYYEDTAFAVLNRGKDRMREFCSNSFHTFPNLHFDVGNVYYTSAGAGWDWTMTGNYRAAIKELRVAATGQAILVKGASITKLRGGFIEHNVDYYDSLKLLQQLGAFPAG